MATAGACNDRALPPACSTDLLGALRRTRRLSVGRGLSSQLAISTRTGCASGATASRRPRERVSRHALPRTPSPAVTLGLLLRQTAELIATQVRQARARWPSHRPQATHKHNNESPLTLATSSILNSESIFRHETRAFVSSTRVMDASVHARDSQVELARDRFVSR